MVGRNPRSGNYTTLQAFMISLVGENLVSAETK